MKMNKKLLAGAVAGALIFSGSAMASLVQTDIKKQLEDGIRHTCEAMHAKIAQVSEVLAVDGVYLDILTGTTGETILVADGSEVVVDTFTTAGGSTIIEIIPNANTNNFFNDTVAKFTATLPNSNTAGPKLGSFAYTEATSVSNAISAIADHSVGARMYAGKLMNKYCYTALPSL